MDFPGLATPVLAAVPAWSSRTTRAHPLDLDGHALPLPPWWRTPGRTSPPAALSLPPAPPRLLGPSPTDTHRCLRTLYLLPFALHPLPQPGDRSIPRPHSFLRPVCSIVTVLHFQPQKVFPCLTFSLRIFPVFVLLLPSNRSSSYFLPSITSPGCWLAPFLPHSLF